jgi:5-methylcytosine-specific restriction endonuclease McrA
MSILKAIKDKIQGIPGTRSSKWPTVRKHHLIANPTCAVCGGTEVLEVHHIKPFNLHPELELDPSNLITLCESKKAGVTCHLFFGHCGDYKSFNKSVREDAKVWKEKIENRPV